MVFKNKLKNLTLLLLFVSFFSISFAGTFPNFSYTTTNYPSGQVDIIGESSSGTGVELFVNSNFISKQKIISNLYQENLTGEIKSTSIPIGATLRFLNLDQLKVFTINISGFGIKTLNYGDYYDFSSNIEGQVTYRNEQTGVSKTITIIDKLEKFNFSDISQNSLLDGKNKINFKITSLKTNKLLSTKNFTVNYDKYSTTISINKFNNISNKKEINITGITSDSQSKLRYVVNQLGTIGNAGMLNTIRTDTSGNFNIIASNFKEGKNTIRFISLDKNNLNLFNGEKIIKVLIDTIPPTMTINSANYNANVNSKRITRNADFTSSQLFVNGRNIVLNISTDAIIINYTLNNQNKTCDTKINTTIKCNLNLINGQNNLTLIAIDIAGNIAKEAHQINFDDKPINIDPKSLNPKQGEVVHFFLNDFKGTVNKPGSKVSIFTIPQDSKYFYNDKNGIQREERATCSNYKYLGSRDWGYADNGLARDPQFDLTDKQISLTDLIQNKVQTTAGADGNFVLKNVILKNKNLNSYDLNKKSNEVGLVTSPNTICYILSDQYGNVNTYSTSVTLDSGNTLWKSAQITAIPSTIYAAEIEQLGSSWTNQGNTRVGIIARIKYVGGGKVKEITAPIVRIDSNFESVTSKYARVITNEMNFKLDTKTGEMILYFPVEILKMNIKPLDYPKNLKLGFRVSVVYSLDNIDIPIDTQNPIYFQTSLNVERPLDNTKWLSPKMIQDALGFLNKSIDYTKKAVKYTGVAAIGGVLACTGAKFYYGLQIANAQSESEKNDYKEKLFYICDRVVCSAAPQKCVGSNLDKVSNKVDPSILKIKDGKGNYNKQELSQNTLTSRDGSKKKLATYDYLSLNENNLCDFNGDGVKDDGILINGEQTIWSEEKGSWIKSDVKSTERLNQRCAKYKKKGFYDSNGKYLGLTNPSGSGTYIELSNSQVDLKSVGSACYSDKAPKFDNTRTLGSPGTNPKDNIIESVRSGCITDTYSHLKKYLQIQKSIQKCLQEAKIGVATGSYCERLMSQAVCDVATNVLFKTIGQKSTRGNENGDPHDNGIGNIFSSAQVGDSLLNDRYQSNSFYNAAGLGSNQVTNKVCLAAFTGDWSVLTNDILGAVDANQVDPTFGPMFPESRMQGYNPITGELAIRYLFTYAGISGGQYISTKVDLICDKSKPGADYCPQGIKFAKNVPGSRLILPNLVISENSAVQDSVSFTDSSAKYRYNVVKLTHTYRIDGKEITKTMEETINHKNSGLLANCYWGTGIAGTSVTKENNYGISCDSLFSSDSIVSAYTLSKDTSLFPKEIKVFYPRNDLNVKLNYDVRDKKNTQNGFDIGYRASCQASNGKTIKIGYKNINNENKIGSSIVESLFRIPSLGNPNEGKTTSYELKLDVAMAKKLTADKKNLKLVFTNNKGQSGQNFEIIKMLGDKISGSSIQINQNLIVNNGGKVSSGSYDLSKKLKDFNFNDGETLSLKLKGDIKGISVKLGDYQFTPAKTFNVINKGEFADLQEGSCDLTLKILPAGKGSQLTYDNFDKISAVGNSADIKTNVGSKNSQVKLSFIVKNTPSKEINPSKDWLGIISPSKNSYLEVCKSNDLNVDYLFQTPNNKVDNKLKVNLSLIANRYDLKFDKISETPTVKPLQNDQYSNFKIPLKNIDKSIINKNLEMTLAYTLKDTSKKEKIKTIDTKNIKFNLKIKDCNTNNKRP